MLRNPPLDPLRGGEVRCLSLQRSMKLRVLVVNTCFVIRNLKFEIRESEVRRNGSIAALLIYSCILAFMHLRI